MLFYEPELRDKALLPHDPFKALIAPRPIGWVTTMSDAGAVNLAPYSFFNAIGDKPPMLAFASLGQKDSLAFAAQTREFVWNMATYDLRHAMNATSAPLPRGENEFLAAGLEMAPCNKVSPPRVKQAPCALECKVTDILRLKDMSGDETQSWLIIGQVIGVHIDPDYIENGIVQLTKMKPISRCGYLEDYTVLENMFAMGRPG